MNFGTEVMKHEMNERHWSQGELAKRCGVDRTTINKICGGINKPSVSLAKKLGEVLDIEWTLFFTPYEEAVEMLNLSEGDIK